ncbi:hypothetical protein GGR57DRAFT_462339 [Xylariaceae sp. FL1272]|nr:hypothetical protein GGR57DRAFT_462339 [Xylariaceae sp. FL1272]
MNSMFPSIQSFYSREIPPSDRDDKESSNSTTAGDGFTSSEVQAVISPLSRSFVPMREYEKCPIVELHSGIYNYEITGRLINYSSSGGPQHVPPSAGEYFFLVISDGTGALAIKLYCKPSECELVLGQRITLWATSISTGNKAEIDSIPFCSSATTIYPGRNGATHIIFHVDEPDSVYDRLLRFPLDVDRGQDKVLGLMTLQTFLLSGHDEGQGKIIVCVKSVGPRRTLNSKKREITCELAEVGIWDDTSSCILKLWGDQIASSKLWRPGHTVLLISKPLFRKNDFLSRRGELIGDLSLKRDTLIYVDPDIPETSWLRSKVQEMTKRARVVTPFPADTWDLELATNGPNRTLYTIAEIDEQVRSQRPSANFTGKLNVVVREMNLMKNRRETKTCCIVCCGIPLFANDVVATCKHCDIRHDLLPNPSLLGSVIDESGMISGSELVWNDQAWTHFILKPSAPGDYLTGSESSEMVAQDESWKELIRYDNNRLRVAEDRLLYSRVTLTFGWSVDLGRLCILDAEW